MDKLARLLGQGLRDGRMRVAQRTDRDAAAQIQIPLARDVVEIAARTVAEHQVEAAITGHDVLLEKRLYRGDVVANDGRRCRNNLFHRVSGFRWRSTYASRFVTLQSVASGPSR